MEGLTSSELSKVREITIRLQHLSSPVLRLQAILQFSQIVDILAIGDTSSPREQELVDEVDRWNEMYSDLAEKCGMVDDDNQ
jgi:hypothetical protein